jgi:asparagine synthase (glutamine-hydrolysing)
MFAFGFYDSVERSLILARDRFGMKPLYTCEESGRLLFTSEIKALRPWWTPTLDEFSISSYLLGFGGPTKGATFYRGVRSVAPGSAVICRIGAHPNRSPSSTVLVGTQTPLGHTCAGGRGSADELLFGRQTTHVCRRAAPLPGGVDSSLLIAIRPAMPTSPFSTPT